MARRKNEPLSRAIVTGSITVIGGEAEARASFVEAGLLLLIMRAQLHVPTRVKPRREELDNSRSPVSHLQLLPLSLRASCGVVV